MASGASPLSPSEWPEWSRPKEWPEPDEWPEPSRPSEWSESSRPAASAGGGEARERRQRAESSRSPRYEPRARPPSALSSKETRGRLGGVLGGGERQQVARRRRAAAREAQAPRQRADLVTRPGPRRHDVGRRRDGAPARRASPGPPAGAGGAGAPGGRAARRLSPEGLEPLPDLAPHAPRHEPGQLLQVVERGQRLDAPPLVLDDALPRGLDVPLREARLAQQGPPRGRLEPPRRAVALRVAQARLLRPRGQLGAGRRRRSSRPASRRAHGRSSGRPGRPRSRRPPAMPPGCRRAGRVFHDASRSQPTSQPGAASRLVVPLCPAASPLLAV